jgi:DNA-binding LacI/PurR family transcriptional regulator
MSITEIADRAGVSASTVSRVINNRPGIAEQTRALVFDTMDKIGYAPKPVTSRPGPKSVFKNISLINNVALLSFCRYRSQVNSPVYAEIIHGVESELARKGVNMLFRSVRNPEEVASWIDKRNLDGLILFGDHEALPMDIVRKLSLMPVVAVLGDSPSYDYDRVSYEKSMVDFLAAEYFVENNVNEVLCIYCSRHTPKFQELANQNGIKLEILCNDDDVFVTNEDMNCPDRNKLDMYISRYLEKNTLPQGIFLPCDSYAVPIYSTLLQRGYVPGRDFKVVSINNETSLLSGLMPRPCTVDIRSFELGRASVQRLLWRCEHPGEPATLLTLPPLLVKP